MAGAELGHEARHGRRRVRAAPLRHTSLPWQRASRRVHVFIPPVHRYDESFAYWTNYSLKLPLYGAPIFTGDMWITANLLHGMVYDPAWWLRSLPNPAGSFSPSHPPSPSHPSSTLSARIQGPPLVP